MSSFHHHFKAVTAVSPLQFQKQLRLQEARRLLLSEDIEVTLAAQRVAEGKVGVRIARQQRDLPAEARLGGGGLVKPQVPARETTEGPAVW